ncbi:PASTA domain-containing protein, partial [Saccharothrix sp. MB29]|nr:PASTA domain-containing protein [Saccharothrix sp. MB29]
DPLSEEEAERRARRKKTIMIAVVVALCVAVLALATWITTTLMGEEDPGVGPTDKVSVPSVVDMTQAAANAAIQDAGLLPQVELVPCQPGAEIPCTAEQIGKVVQTDPPANREVEKRSSVKLFIGKAADQVEVPSVAGMSP